MAKTETIKHRVGLLIPSSNTNVEPVYNSVMPGSVSVHAARLAMTEVSKHVFPRQGRTFDTGSGSSPT
jgi:maleate cis-trans isomerase